MKQDGFIEEVKPLTPEEVASQKEHQIHPQIIASINELLVTHYIPGTITIKQQEILDLFLGRTSEDWTLNRVFKEKQLNIESVYKKYGWKVEYDKPGFNESGEAFFKFTPIK